MTGLITTCFADLPSGATCARLRLAAPRANALEPGLLLALSEALDAAEKGRADVILLASAGRNFCSGGDVARFAEEVAAGRGVCYANKVVPLLQEIVLRLLSMPRLVALAGKGAITGGGAGLLFASDLAVLSPDAFVQPWYTVVGFAPDGGWTAILPERIGAGAAAGLQLTNRRLDAAAAQAMGLAAAVDADPEARALALLSDVNIDSAKATKRLIWDRARLRLVEARLKAETTAFRARIAQPDTVAGMARFLETSGRRDHA